MTTSPADNPKTVTCRDLDGHTYVVPVADLVWRPSVYGIVIRDGKVLLCRHFGKYNLPGGGVDMDESLEDALLREIKEETGITAAKPELMGVTEDYFMPPYKPTPYHTILMYYACDYVSGEPSMDGFDEDERVYAELAQWVDADTIDDWDYTSTVDYRPFVRQALSRTAGASEAR
jgi:8-oxo-dGTP diphosphatase